MQTCRVVGNEWKGESVSLHTELWPDQMAAPSGTRANDQRVARAGAEVAVLDASTGGILGVASGVRRTPAFGFALAVAGLIAGTSACKCGHTPELHLHFRKGTDCADCPCTSFKAVSLRSAMASYRLNRSMRSPGLGRTL